MAARSMRAPQPRKVSESITLGSVLLRLMALMLFCAGGSWLIIQMWLDGFWQLAAISLVITLAVTIIWVRPETYPLRWMSPGLAFMVLISVYPILYTVYLSFTNFGTGNLLPKSEAIAVIQNRTYLSETGGQFAYTLYQGASGEYALLLQPPDGPPVVVLPGQTIPAERVAATDGQAEPPAEIRFGLDDAPYQIVPRNQMLAAIAALRGVTFGAAPYAVQVTGTRTAATLERQFVYDASTDTVVDRQNNITFVADDERGAFVAADGQILNPGYIATVGGANYSRFFTNPSFRGPLAAVFVWTVVYALLATVLSFALGLLIAIAFGRNMPGKTVIQSLLLIPFAIPNVISILVWRGLLNPINGVYGTTISSLFGRTVDIFADPTMVKIALIVVSVWLSYPYFFLVSSGALQAIPLDMYEAAELDGANWWQQFRWITLPLLLVAVGPLLIGAFMYNFNQFNVVYLFNEGGPPMVGTSTPAGHSDILISYVYQLAFGSSGQDFGYASAITVIIFAILLGVTLMQYRFMNTLEKVSDNV